MNARQARQRRALLHPHWFASANRADRTEDSTNNLSQNSTITDDPARIVVPSEYRERGISPELSPVNTVEPERGTSHQQSAPRCQFSFSDGRHCRLPRAQHDPRFCLHHTANNVKAKKARKRSRAGQAIELKTPSGNFTTATDLNYALSQVFRSLAQNRIRPRNAAALGYLGQLLLQTLPGVKSEFSNTFGYRAWDESVQAMLKSGPNEKHLQLAHNEHLTIRPGSSSRASIASEGSLLMHLMQQNEHLRQIQPQAPQNEHLRKP
jgi:hypothetical protein